MVRQTHTQREKHRQRVLTKTSPFPLRRERKREEETSEMKRKAPKVLDNTRKRGGVEGRTKVCPGVRYIICPKRTSLLRPLPIICPNFNSTPDIVWRRETESEREENNQEGNINRLEKKTRRKQERGGGRREIEEEGKRE
jgi:hypothetical protein